VFTYIHTHTHTLNTSVNQMHEHMMKQAKETRGWLRVHRMINVKEKKKFLKQGIKFQICVEN